ncbi:MAG: AAA family ATPase [Deltaproteobacteria bacterium]|nr:AAA family ATPase [Deltaproteobacteria bacterium]
MYLNFYQLRKAPFNITPDPEFLFFSPSHQQVLETIQYGLAERKGFMVVTSEVGLGKTTLVRFALERADLQRLKVIFTFHAHVSFTGLLETLARELHIDCHTEDLGTTLQRLQEVLTAEGAQGRTVVLIIDEAQNLPVETLRHLRLLANLETATKKLLQIVLVGQPELAQKLDLPELQPLKQCIAIRSTLSPLTPQESLAYIQHRLTKVTLGQTPTFTTGALKQIVAHAQGAPRLLNILCDNALIAGFAAQQKPVSASLVREVIADFEGNVETKGASSLARPRLAWALGLVLIGLLGFVSYRGLGAFKGRSPDLSQAHQPGSTALDPQDKQTALAVVPARDIPGQEAEKSPAAAGSQVLADPPQAKAAVQPAEPPTKTQEAPAPPQTTFPVTLVVKPGDSLTKMIAAVYGSSTTALVQRVKDHNPQIQDANIIVVGETIVFPAFNGAMGKGDTVSSWREGQENEDTEP